MGLERGDIQGVRIRDKFCIKGTREIVLEELVDFSWVGISAKQRDSGGPLSLEVVCLCCEDWHLGNTGQRWGRGPGVTWKKP